MVLDLNTTILILGSIMTVIGGAIGLKLAASRGKSMSNDSFQSRLGILQAENKELKKYLSSVKGTLAQTKQGLTLPEGTDLENQDSGFDNIIKGLIGKYSSMVPPQLRPFLQDPAVINFLLSEAKKNPEQTKEILKNFISNNGSVTKSTDGGSTNQQLEETVSTGA